MSGSVIDSSLCRFCSRYFIKNGVQQPELYTPIASLTLPSTIKYLGERFVSGCVNLTSFRLPEGFTETPQDVFKGCEALSNILLPESLTTISKGFLSMEENLGQRSACKALYISGAVTKIDATLPSDLTVIRGIKGSYAQEYAEECGYDFEDTTPEKELKRYNDNNLDNISTAVDESKAYTEISSPEDLQKIENDMDGNYRLTKDIDVSSLCEGDTGWQPFGIVGMLTGAVGVSDSYNTGKVAAKSVMDGSMTWVNDFINALLGIVEKYGYKIERQPMIYNDVPNNGCGYMAGIVGQSFDAAGGPVEHCYNTGEIAKEVTQSDKIVIGNEDAEDNSTVDKTVTESSWIKSRIKGLCVGDVPIIESYYLAPEGEEYTGGGADDSSYTSTALTADEFKDIAKLPGLDFNGTWYLAEGMAAPQLIANSIKKITDLSKVTKGTLIADRVLDVRSYGKMYAPLFMTSFDAAGSGKTYSELRSWLNGWDADWNASTIDFSGAGFMQQAFDGEEQKSLTPLEQLSNPADSYWNRANVDEVRKENVYIGIPGRNEVTDTWKYQCFQTKTYIQDPNKQAKGSDYVAGLKEGYGLDTGNEDGYSEWICDARDGSNIDYCLPVVNADGTVDKLGRPWTDKLGIRPVIEVNLDAEGLADTMKYIGTMDDTGAIDPEAKVLAGPEETKAPDATEPSEDIDSPEASSQPGDVENTGVPGDIDQPGASLAPGEDKETSASSEPGIPTGPRDSSEPGGADSGEDGRPDATGSPGASKMRFHLTHSMLCICISCRI